MSRGGFFHSIRAMARLPRIRWLLVVKVVYLTVVAGSKWVEGWLGLPGPDCTNTLYLRQSLLGPYLGREVSIWQCPSATRPVVLGQSRLPRVRTVSLNGFLGSPVESSAATTYRRLGEITRPGPSEIMTFEP